MFSQCPAVYYSFALFQESFTLVIKRNKFIPYRSLEEGKEKVLQIIKSNNNVTISKLWKIKAPNKIFHNNRENHWIRSSKKQRRKKPEKNIHTFKLVDVSTFL